eukprot:jgi/Chlat1/5641/Chrsp369S05395
MKNAKRRRKVVRPPVLPAPKVVARASAFDHPNSKLGELVCGHPFNHALELILPVLDGTPQAWNMHVVLVVVQKLKWLGGAPMLECIASCQLHFVGGCRVACMAHMLAVAHVDSGFQQAAELPTTEAVFGVKDLHFSIARAPLTEILDIGFLHRHIKASGQLYALSTSTPIDRTDAVAIANGHMHIAATKETYESLGLVGELHKRCLSSIISGVIVSCSAPMQHEIDRAANIPVFGAGTASLHCERQRYNISVDLAHKTFAPGYQYYDRVQSRLDARMNTPLSLRCVYTEDGKPTNIAWPPGVPHSIQPVSMLIRRLDSVPPPPLRADSIHLGLGRQQQPSSPTCQPDAHIHLSRGNTRASSLLAPECLSAALDWIGAVSSGIVGQVSVVSQTPASPLPSLPMLRGWERDNTKAWPWSSTQVDASVPNTAPHSDDTSASSTVAARWTGMLAPAQVLAAIDFARSTVASKQLPWAVVSVWGFADSPVSWHRAEHGFAFTGENDYALLLLPSDNYILFSVAGNHDSMR